jgi:hypothetical protein
MTSARRLRHGDLRLHDTVHLRALTAPRRLRPGRTLLAVGALVVAAAFVAPQALFQRPGGAGDVSSVALLSSAAARLELVLAQGPRIAFFAVQRNYLRPRTDQGAQIETASGLSTSDPADRFVNGFMTQGEVTPSDYRMAIRGGLEERGAPDFSKGFALFSVVQRSGVTWRDDGNGWERTDVSPGLGMDPVTIRVLPQLLRHVGASADSDRNTRTDGMARFKAVVPAELYPGVVAADGLPFTSPVVEVEVWIDQTSAVLVRLDAAAANLNERAGVLISRDRIDFRVLPPQ